MSISRFNIAVPSHEKFKYVWRGCRSIEELHQYFVSSHESELFKYAEYIYSSTKSRWLDNAVIDASIIEFNNAVEEYNEFAQTVMYGKHIGIDFRHDLLDEIKEQLQYYRDSRAEMIDEHHKLIAESEARVAAALADARSRRAGPPLTQTEADSFRVAVQKCWVVDIGSPAANVTVVLGMQMTPEGKVKPGSLRLVSAQGGTDAATKTAFQLARRAVLRCQKGGYNLPTEKYEHWREIKMTFNPEIMR
jgi:hypothetical protein